MNDLTAPVSVKRIAFVPPRYGRDLGGGAEALTADLAALLNGAGLQIEIWTTCARDHRTWENFYPAGKTLEDGLTVRRFPVDPRDLETFLAAEIKLSEGRQLTIEEQIGWLENSVNSTALYQHIAAAGPGFDVIVFAPYLFATSFWGSLIYPEKSAIIPCLHDEAYAYLPVFAQQFSKVRRLIFNSEPEMHLAQTLYPQADIAAKGRVVGMSFAPEAQDTASELPAGIEPGRYLLYSGRKERGKNLDLAIDYFSRVRAAKGSGLKFVMIGAGRIDFMTELPEGVIDLGFVDASFKSALMRDCLALVQPSTNESFSIVLMECWLAGRPVVVNGHCAVTKFHAEQSGGGLYFNDAAEFSAVISRLAADPGLAAGLGRAGRSYVLSRYSPDEVRRRLFSAIEFAAAADSAIHCDSSGA